MADLYTTLQQMRADGTIETIARNPLAQFGRRARPYLGASLLPEQFVLENQYREETIRYRTVVANDGTRYSPVQKKGADLTGSFLVELAHSDIGQEFSGRDYDALLRLLSQNASMEAIVALTRWADTVGNLALVENNERMIWEAIVGASVALRGDNKYAETVAYSNPAAHRVAEAASWSTDSTDIFADIATGVDKLASLGYTVNRLITSRPVVSIMAGNDTVKSRVGFAVVNASGQIESAGGRASIAAINGALQADGLPPIEQYDLQYRTSTGTGYFLARDVMVMLATTGRDDMVDIGDDERYIPDTLGYMAVGRPAGQANPGRVLQLTPQTNKPPRIELEGWQTSLPVITEPEAIYVINTIT